MPENTAPDPQEPKDSHEPEITARPETLAASDFGFDEVCSVQLATHGLLKHFQRLGMSVLPMGADSNEVMQRLVFPELADADSTATHSAEAVSDSGSTTAVEHSRSETAPQSPTQPSPIQPAKPLESTQRPATAPPSERRRPAAPIALSTGSAYELPVLSLDDRTASLNAASQQVAACRLCPQLVVGRRNTVYGEGSSNPRVCFFGEAPGAEEDQSGRPFVGRAGQLLTKMIQACTFAREDTYILNTVKCRPPGNRNPEQDEVENCRAFFEHQFEILQPEYIVCLGLVAAKALLQTTLSVGRLRGVFHQYKASKVVVTYHPSYLLRNPDAKRAAWDDLQMMLRDMGIDPKTGKQS